MLIAAVPFSYLYLGLLYLPLSPFPSLRFSMPFASLYLCIDRRAEAASLKQKRCPPFPLSLSRSLCHTLSPKQNNCYLKTRAAHLRKKRPQRDGEEEGKDGGRGPREVPRDGKMREEEEEDDVIL